MAKLLNSEEMKNNEIVLTQLRETAQKAFSGHALMNLTLTTWKKDIINGLVCQLSTSIIAEELINRTKAVCFEYPTSWWQMFKQQYFTKWLLIRFPVETKKDVRLVSFEEYATYPKFPKVAPKEMYGGKIVYRTFTIEEKRRGKPGLLEVG